VWLAVVSVRVSEGAAELDVLCIVRVVQTNVVECVEVVVEDTVLDRAVDVDVDDAAVV
jgi:hypothetical protein